MSPEIVKLINHQNVCLDICHLVVRTVGFVLMSAIYPLNVIEKKKLEKCCASNVLLHKGMWEKTAWRKNMRNVVDAFSVYKITLIAVD